MSAYVGKRHWLNLNIYVSTPEYERMEAGLTPEIRALIDPLDPRHDAQRPKLARLILERLSAAYIAKDLDAFRFWLNIMGAAIVKLVEPDDSVILWVPGTQLNNGILCLFLLTGTSGERIFINWPERPYLSFPDDTVGSLLRFAFKTLFGDRAFRGGGKPLSRLSGDGIYYLVLEVPDTAKMECPCRSDFPLKKYPECHGAVIADHCLPEI